MSVPEHKIRTAIKAYLDAGGDPEFYIVSKKMIDQHKSKQTLTITASDKCDYCEERMKHAGANPGILVVHRACDEHLKKAQKELAEEIK